MNRLTRPPKPDNWDSRPMIVRAHTDLAAMVKSGKAPTSEDFPELWRSLGATEAFSRTQKRICGYCGRREGSPLHLDHFQPRTEVSRGIVAQGAERDGVVNAEGRRLEPTIRPAYWWRAYDWSNFVASCERCNVAWKQTLFPVEHPTNVPPVQGGEEKPLLLNPFEVDDPLEHLDFDEQGAIADKTVKGDWTIRVCGLDRASLTVDRRDRLSGWIHHIEDLLRAGVPPEERAERVRDLVRAGAWDEPFAAALRATAARRGIRWSDLEAKASGLGQA